MRFEIQPYDAANGDEDSQNGENEGISANGEIPSPTTQKCEVREYVARYGLTGEQKLKLVKEVDNTSADNDDDAEEARKYCMRSEKWFSREGEMYLQTLEIYSIHIQKALRETISEYPGTNLQANPIILTGTLKCIFHYRQELAKYREHLQDPVAKLHLSLLLRFMGRELQRAIRSYKANVEGSPENPTTDFTNLWMVFKPGDYVITGRNDTQRILQLQRTWYSCGSDPKWHIIARALNHDGETYGYVEYDIKVSSFQDSRLVSKLSVYPLKYCKTAEVARQALVDRGKKFHSLVGCHYRSYHGIAKALGEKRDVDQYGQVDEFPTETTMISGRIMIDTKMFAVFKSPNRVTLDDRRSTEEDISEDSQVFSDDEYMIFHNLVPGFSLNEKKWCFFYVDVVEPVQLNETAFDHLLLPEEQKRIVYALVRTHSRDNGGFDDMIKGKGKGLIFVLHGVPGVGKTYTAESVADTLKRPLYVLHSGDLGVTPESVETNLSNALMLATTWQAVLLIDEADVFLEQRSVQDLTRNCLVSLFLRILEYYQGILFLTTNRIVTFDLAFKSRIHLALKYNALDASQRKQLWELFINRVPSAANKIWPKQDLEELAAVDLNGRQIKNAVRTAHSLACSEDGELEQQHLRTVLRTLESFERDLNEDTQDATCFTPKMIRRQSTLMSKLALSDGSITEEPASMK